MSHSLAVSQPLADSALRSAGAIRRERLQRWSRILVGFVVGQTGTQVLNLLVGFALLRWLTKEDYAQVSFALGFQAMLALLLDLGAGSAIPALVSTRIHDPNVVGGYVDAARALRWRLAWVIVPLGAIGFVLAGARHAWSWLTIMLLLGSVVAAVFAQAAASIHAAPLTMHRRLGAWYAVGTVAGTARLVVFGVLQWLGALSGWLTAWVNAAATGASALLYRRAARIHCATSAPVSAEKRRAMLRYLAPLIPGVAFTALQGQITLFLIAAFGRSENIAEVAALGRLGQVFALLAAFNGVVLQPYMAALPRERLWARYGFVFLSAISVAGTITLVGWRWPQPLLWLLGSNYAHLESELRLLLLASSLQYLGGVMWAMHAARRWVFWWGSAAYIGGTVLVQAIVVATSDLSQTRDVILFSVWTALAALAVHVATAIDGFSRRSGSGSP